ncbi:MAG: GntR family transcriptional regulator [Desulfobacteraceae bacterium]|jgi:DNA-binding GntR family transcriptional regulator
MPILEKIRVQKAPTIREELYKNLRLKILAGEIDPDERLIEAKLAEETGTSRTPVREALHKLEMENLIESIPRVGYVVREITENELDEILQIRLALETLAAKWAAQRITPEELKRLDEIVRLTEKSIEAEDPESVIGLDAEFHEIICKASRSRRLEEMSQSLRDHMLRLRLKGLGVPEIARRSNEGHRKIVQAIKGKNKKEIEEAIAVHLNGTRRSVRERIHNGGKPA